MRPLEDKFHEDQCPAWDQALHSMYEVSSRQALTPKALQVFSLNS